MTKNLLKNKALRETNIDSCKAKLVLTKTYTAKIFQAIALVMLSLSMNSARAADSVMTEDKELIDAVTKLSTTCSANVFEIGTAESKLIAERKRLVALQAQVEAWLPQARMQSSKGANDPMFELNSQDLSDVFSEVIKLYAADEHNNLDNLTEVRLPIFDRDLLAHKIVDQLRSIVTLKSVNPSVKVESFQDIAYPQIPLISLRKVQVDTLQINDSLPLPKKELKDLNTPQSWAELLITRDKADSLLRGDNITDLVMNQKKKNPNIRIVEINFPSLLNLAIAKAPGLALKLIDRDMVTIDDLLKKARICRGVSEDLFHDADDVNGILKNVQDNKLDIGQRADLRTLHSKFRAYKVDQDEIPTQYRKVQQE